MCDMWDKTPWISLDSLAKLEKNSGVAMHKRSRWNLLLFVRFLEIVRYARKYQGASS